jgi:hypothetical protein
LDQKQFVFLGFAILGLGHQGNLRINHYWYKFADLRFALADLKNCVFAIVE